MGKKIDRFVLNAAAGFGFYLFYRDATGSAAISVLLALLSCIILRRILRRVLRHLNAKPFIRKRRIRRETSGAILRLACLDAESAAKDIRTLLERHYHEVFNVALIQAHPSDALTRAAVFEAWKEKRDFDRLVICATCTADTECRALAASLKSPRVALIDSAALSRLIAEHPEGLMPERIQSRPAQMKMRKYGAWMLNRRDVPKNLLLSVAMTTIYLLSGNPAYLLGAIFLLTVVLLSLRRPSAPAKLF